MVVSEKITVQVERIPKPGSKGKSEKVIPQRGGWGNKLDFVFSCIAYAVGLGNVWRFPYLCYKNGGGAFLIPYFLAMVTCGIPLFFQEVAVGQYLGVGGMSVVGQLCPILKGVGYAALMMVFLENVYYIVIVAWTFFYLVASFTAFPGLPWQDCDNEWNTKMCYSSQENFTGSWLHQNNHTKDNASSPVEEYWEKRVLAVTNGITTLGGLRWELVGYLALAWAIVYLVIWRGLHHSGKIIWFTAIFPYVILTVLLGRALTLEGSMDGLKFLVTPQWNVLLTSEPWIDGGTQIFFSYGVGIGALLALGSYNSFHHNCYKDALIVCCINTFTSLFSGCVTFSVLGHMAWKAGKGVGDVVKSGPGLAFLAYPEVVLQLPAAPFWAALFFLMLLTLGIDSQFCGVESLVTGLVDNWPKVLRPHRKKFTFLMCLLMFLIALPMVTNGGIYIFQMMDFYSASGMSLLWCCFFQTVAISWIFGAKKFYGCIEQMIGYQPCSYWLICWLFTAPVVMVSIFIFYFVKYQPLTYGHSYEYPWWGELLGFAISLSSMIWVVAYMFYFILTTKGSITVRLMKGITPRIKGREDMDMKLTDEVLCATMKCNGNSQVDPKSAVYI